MTGVTYMPHQAEAIRKLRSGSILCGGVGSGKSIAALGYFHDVECKAVEWTDGEPRGPMQDPKPLYIITTARKRDTHEWEAEIDGFPDLDIPVTIDSWNNIEKYIEVFGAFFIFDEQRVVGRGAWVKAFWKIAKRNHWILLSATPGDTWADYMPVFVANGFYRNQTEFFRRHAVYSRFCTKYPKIERWVEVAELERLRRRITVTMEFEKKTKREWHNVAVPYDEEKYGIIAKDRWNPYENIPIQDISAACQLMRRAANSALVEGMANHTKFLMDARSLEIFHILVKRKRVIVFYNYDYELETMRRTFADITDIFDWAKTNFFSVAEWNGHKHEPIPDAERWIYLVQYNAGAEGWNCVLTDTIAFYSQNYSYKMMEQAAGRIDRLNTPFDILHYYVLRSDAPIDKAIARTLKLKKTFNEKLFLKSWDA